MASAITCVVRSRLCWQLSHLHPAALSSVVFVPTASRGQKRSVVQSTIHYLISMRPNSSSQKMSKYIQKLNVQGNQ